MCSQIGVSVALRVQFFDPIKVTMRRGADHCIPSRKRRISYDYIKARILSFKDFWKFNFPVKWSEIWFDNPKSREPIQMFFCFAIQYIVNEF